MAKFLEYIEAMNIIEGDTEGDGIIYIRHQMRAYGIQGNIAIFEFYPITADAIGSNSNKGTAAIPLEVFATNQNQGYVELPFPSMEAEGEIRTARAQIYWPVIQTDAFLTFNPWAHITLPTLEVIGFGNPNRIYELCLNTNEGL
jgi:hypothetical protein